MICGMKPTTTRHVMSCRQRLARKRGVLLGTAHLQQQMHRWQVDLNTAAAAGTGAQPMDARPQQAAIPQPPQRACADTQRGARFIKGQPLRAIILHDTERFPLIAG
jgi:hypothetical protein